MERGTTGSTESNVALMYLKDAMKDMSKEDVSRTMRLLMGVNRICRSLEIIAQINDCKASSDKLALKPFCQILLKEYKGKIEREYSKGHRARLVGHLKTYVFSKIRFATRMCRPKLYFGRLDPNRQDLIFRQDISEQA